VKCLVGIDCDRIRCFLAGYQFKDLLSPNDTCWYKEEPQISPHRFRITVAISSAGEKEGKKLRGMIARKEPGGYAVQFTGRLNE
jgi:hypothetical protein